MRLLSALTAGALLLASPAGELQAQESGSASEAVLFLVLPVGAKGVGMARAMWSLQGPKKVWRNPAGDGGEAWGRRSVEE